MADQTEEDIMVAPKGKATGGDPIFIKALLLVPKESAELLSETGAHVGGCEGFPKVIYFPNIIKTTRSIQLIIDQWHSSSTSER